jgi:outer membrane protein TolC
VLRLHTALEQESLLRYNGMLKSTWDLLASARQRIQSTQALHQAQTQAWLAWADLQAVLNGLAYTGQLNLDAGKATSQPSAGH